MKVIEKRERDEQIIKKKTEMASCEKKKITHAAGKITVWYCQLPRKTWTADRFAARFGCGGATPTGFGM